MAQDITSDISDIQMLIAKGFKDDESDEFSVSALSEAANRSSALLTRIIDIVEYAHNKELQVFLEELLLITKKLHSLSLMQEQEHPPKNQLMSNLTTGFEKFINKTFSKKNQVRMRKMAQFIPSIDNIVHCCETVPYYWDHASFKQKIGIVLGVALIVAAVALTIATNVAPALASLYILPPAIMCLVHLGRKLYEHVY